MEIRFDDVLALPFAKARAALLAASNGYADCQDVGGTGRKKKTKQSSMISPTDPTCTAERVRQALDHDGYHVLRPSWRVDVGAVADSIRRLDQLGYPASFLLMFDSTWAMAKTATEIVQATVSKELVCNMDILAWLVDPKRGHTGFSPHRDRQPDDVHASFLSEKTPQGGTFLAPRYLTYWVALAGAHPANSCMYMVPKHKDPGYLDGDKDDLDPLERCLSSKEDYQSIRAFPLEPGQAVCFSHRTLHWGSKGSALESTEPRISIALAFSDPAFEPPYLCQDTYAPPSAPLRFALFCAQMICYHERFSFDAKKLNFFKKCFDMEAEQFHVSYRRKVSSEFIAAVIETQTLKGGQLTCAEEPAPPPASSSRKRKGRAAESDINTTKTSSKRAKVATSKEKKEFASSTVNATHRGSSSDDEEDLAMEAALEAVLDGDRDGSYFVGNDDYEDSD